MGNVESVQEKAKDQDNTVNTDNYEFASEPVCVQNGPATIQNAQPVSAQNQKNDFVDARASEQQNNVSISSQNTMEIGSISDENGKNLGTEAKSDVSPAKSRFRMSISRPVPGRTANQAKDLSSGSVRLDVSSEEPPVNNALNENTRLPETAELKESSDKNQEEAPISASLTAAEVPTPQPSEEENAPPKPSLFDKLFKPEKAKEKQTVPSEDFQVVQTTAAQEPIIVVNASSGLQSSAPPEQNIADCNQNTVNLQSSDSFSSSENLQEPETKPDNKTATSTEDHPVMSFFKTLVSTNKSPSKAEEEPKKEPDDKKKENGACKKSTAIGFSKKSSKQEKVKGGQPVLQLKTETQSTGSKTKTPESPKTKKGTLSRLFRHKYTKEAQQTTGTNVVQEPAVVSVTVKSEKTAPTQTAKQDTKTSESPVQQQITISPEIQKDDAKEKAGKESTPRARLFWKKNPAEPEMEAVKVESTVQAAAPSKDDSKSQEADEKAKKAKAEESRTPKPKLMTFFKQLTLDSTDGAATKPPEKSVAPAAVEAQPAAQKSKDTSKEKKMTVELSKQKGSKQETKENQEAPSSTPQPAPETGLLQNGGGSPKDSPRRLEKRQSIGSFFKGIGPKRTCDAEAQTDPVSILPAEKTK